MCSLSFCRMEVHHGIRNARLQGDYSDYALTEPCPLRSTDDPSGSKDVPGRALVTWTNNRKSRQNGAMQQSSIDPTQISIDSYWTNRSTCTRRQARSNPYSSSIDHHQDELDRSHAEQQLDRSPCFSRSINPGQMISQPFDLLGANRLDRTTANRIEPKSTPELFRPIFSHCLGYAVFQSLHCFHCFRGRRDQTSVFTVWRRFLNPCFSIFIFDSMTFSFSHCLLFRYV
ncbi:unnamed protein product [Microthlaspi erraticum]|uniref:Uncharacterized protein n=1 Tax=Microthlaspi erraticum TaxID=1685480 RepID=A0A6D2HWG9_9BRAS|nr:unnamed protein product [Microthlaspi erraticum]